MTGDRNQLIVEMIASGQSVADVAAKFGLKVPSIYRICRERGSPVQNVKDISEETMKSRISARRKYQRDYQSIYNKRPGVRARKRRIDRERNKCPEIRSRKQEYDRNYLNRPNVRQAKREYQREYNKNPEVKKRLKDRNNRGFHELTRAGLKPPPWLDEAISLFNSNVRRGKIAEKLGVNKSTFYAYFKKWTKP
jgi:predicted DNA-binding transcriptional regulator AlpA